MRFSVINPDPLSVLFHPALLCYPHYPCSSLAPPEGKAAGAKQLPWFRHSNKPGVERAARSMSAISANPKRNPF